MAAGEATPVSPVKKDHHHRGDLNQQQTGASAAPRNVMNGRIRRLMMRQSLGRDIAPQQLMRGLAYDPLDYLVLDYASHKHSGRMDYSFDEVDPLLAIASTTNFSMTIWKHSVTASRPVKLLSFPGLHTAPASSVQWSSIPELRSELYTTSEDGTCKIFNAAERQIVASLTLPQGMAPFAAGAIDRTCLAVGYGRQAGLWDRRMPQLSVQPKSPQHTGGIVTDLAPTLGAPLLFSSSVDGTVKVWDMRRGLDSCLSTLIARPQDEGVASLHLHTGNTRLLVGCEASIIYDVDLDGIFRNSDWHIDPDEDCLLVRKVYRGGVNRCNLKRARRSYDGRYVMCGSDDGNVWLWDAESQQVARKLDGSQAAPILGNTAINSPLLSAVMSRTSPWLQIAFSTDLASVLFSYRESANGSVADNDQVDLLDDVLVEEGGEEEHEVYGEEGMEEEDVQAWERDRLGLQEGECSYNRGYVTQLVFVCETCSANASSRAGAAAAGGASSSSSSSAGDASDQSSSKEASLEPGMHGLCVSCAHHCHEIIGHTVKNIGEKRHFRCDCGNKQFQRAGRLGNHLLCSLQCEKEPFNRNVYNHNFKDRWCYCDGPEVLPMIQCLSCRDWFHQNNCVHDSYNFARDEFDQGEDYLCHNCLETPDLLFLKLYPSKALVDRTVWGIHGEVEEEELPPTSTDAAPSMEEARNNDDDAMDVTEQSVAGAARAPVNVSSELCQICKRPGILDNPHLKLLQCSGPPLPPVEGEEGLEQEEGGSKVDTGDNDQQPCNALCHPSCLPPQPGADANEQGQFCCPECCAQAGIDIVKSDLTTDKVDSALPAIGWRMQKGRFLQPDWESILVSPEHKEMARRALAIESAPPVVTISSGNASSVAFVPNNAFASAAAAFTAASATATSSSTGPSSLGMTSETGASSSSSAVAAVGGGEDSSDIFMNNLIARPSEVEDYEAAIKEAIMQGNESKAFRLAMQKIVSHVSQQAMATRRSLILPSDVAHAAEEIRGNLGGRRESSSSSSSSSSQGDRGGSSN